MLRIGRWGVAVSMALAMGTLGSQTALAASPQLVSLSVTPSPFDASGGPVTMTVTARVTDADGDFEFSAYTFRPTGGEVYDQTARFLPLWDYTRISGDAADGIYQGTFQFPQYAPTGSWEISVHLWDECDATMGCQCGDPPSSPCEFLETDDLASLGLPSTIENVASIGDSSEPVLLEFSISPTVVDTTTAAATVTFTARVTDDLAGVYDTDNGYNGGIATNHCDDTGCYGAGVQCFRPANRISGDTMDGTYQCSYEVPQGVLGLFDVIVISRDIVGNVLQISGQELIDLGFPSAFLSGKCGNGTLDPDEQCDDGNLTPTDGCESDCTPTGRACGDGFLHAEEECDDGDLIDGDGCDSNCRPTGCGNGARTLGETCDDGALDADDGCTASCELDEGILDPAYGVDGVALGSEMSVPWERSMRMALQADGSAVVAYSSYEGGQPEARLALTRHTGDGSVDLGFGTNGKVFTSIPGTDALASGVVIQPDGKIVAIAWPSSMSTSDFIVRRFLADGSLDTSFGSGGTATPPVGTHGAALDVALDSTGRIVVAGNVQNDGETFMLARFNSNGSLDTSFGSGGLVLNPDLGYPTGVVLQPDGKIVTLTRAERENGDLVWGRISVSRFLDNGAVDSSFGSGGRTKFTSFLSQNQPGAIALQPDGKIVVGTDIAGAGASGFVALRLNTNGSPDTSFHGDGISAVIDVDSRPGELVNSVIIGADGRITLVGTRGQRDIVVARYLPSGLPDPGLVGKGWLTMGSADAYTSGGDDAAIDSDGRLVLATWFEPPSQEANLAMLRLLVGTCGDAWTQSADGEQCDDGNATAGDGCEPDCTLTPLVEPVTAGGTVSTGAQATPAAPVQIALTSPGAGTVSIAPETDPDVDPSIVIVGIALHIEAPPATAADPLSITLIVDASALPPGTGAAGLGAFRDGSAIAACIGTPGVASPDPCVSERAELPDGDVRLVVLTSHASLWALGLRGLRADEQDCVNGVGKGAASIAKAQGGVNLSCVSAAVADVSACLQTDTTGKVAKAVARLSDTVDEACSPAPPFGFSDATTAADASEVADRNLIYDLFGDDPGSVLAVGDKCQAGAAKALVKFFDKLGKTVLKCTKLGLAGGDVPLVVSSADLATCVEAVDPASASKFAKERLTLAKALDKKCPLDRSTLLPGACGAATDTAACLGDAGVCRLCQAFDATWALGVDCDALDNGFGDGSCE